MVFYQMMRRITPIIVPIEYEQEPRIMFRQNLKLCMLHIQIHIYTLGKSLGDPQNIRGHKAKDQVDYQNEDIIFLSFDPFRTQGQIIF